MPSGSRSRPSWRTRVLRDPVQTVDADTRPHRLDREGLPEHRRGGLRGAVGGHRRQGQQACHRGHQHQVALPPVDHRGQHGPDRQHHGPVVQVQDVFPVFPGQRFGQPRHHGSRVGDQHVHPAFPVADVTDGGRQGRRVGAVRGVPGDPQSFPGALPSQVLGPFRVQFQSVDPASLPPECQRDGPAQARPGARDHHDPIPETPHPILPRTPVANPAPLPGIGAGGILRHGSPIGKGRMGRE